MQEWLLALVLFILVAGFTPGPNNIIAMSIGFNYGYKKVIPHIMGVAVGFPIMLLLIGFVLMPFINRYQTPFLILKYVTLLYLIYLAYKIAFNTIDSHDLEAKEKKPITFFQSLLFQWINPKAWAGAISTISIYLPKGKEYSSSLFIASFVSCVTIVAAISMWTLIGKKIKAFLLDPTHIKIFNISMALLLIVSVLMMML